jgi:hypothetical protein
LSPRALLAAVAAAAALFAAAPGSRAQDPGRWRDAARTVIPIEYFQGLTSDPLGNLWFDGIIVGVYRTTPTLTQVNGVDNIIPLSVSATEGYNHIGDIGMDMSGGGRLVLPLECYDPSRSPANFCGTGAFGVADPNTLTWEFYVKLDVQDIQKAMWAEVDPRHRLVWTSSGPDLLAYRTGDISVANAAPGGSVVRPWRRLSGAVPPSGITGATFYGGRLFVAGSDTGPFQVWSIDVTTGSRRLEIERALSGESEGLDSARVLGGTLHWQIQPITSTPPPTFAEPSLLSFLPVDPVALRVRVRPRALSVGKRSRLRVSVTGTWRAEREPLPGARVTVAGERRTTNQSGQASFRVRPTHAGRLRILATALGESPGSTTVPVR